MKGLIPLTILILANLLSACSSAEGPAATPAATDQSWWSAAASRIYPTATRVPISTETGLQIEQANEILPDLVQSLPGATMPGGGSGTGIRRLELQAGTPMYTSNFSHTEQACAWMGVGGQAIGGDSWPATDLYVELGGTLDGRLLHERVQTGSSQKWGPGGYEFTLADRPIESQAALWLQFFDGGGTPLSDRIYFNTSADCFRNAVMINVVEVFVNQPSYLYLPTIQRNFNTKE